jgi:hypothetical protein
VEYLVLVCLIAASAIGVVSVVGKNIKEQYANISAALSGGKRVQVTTPDSAAYKDRGMDDFMESAHAAKGGGWK